MKKTVLLLIAVTFYAGVGCAEEKKEKASNAPTAALKGYHSEYIDPLQEKIAALEKEQVFLQTTYDQAAVKLNEIKQKFVENAGAIKALHQVGRDAKTGQFISVADAKANPDTTVVEKLKNGSQE